MGDVSIIIPVYNKVDLTKQCLDKLFELQSQDILEVIIVDDGSQDKTKNFLSTLSATNSSIRVIFNEKNFGFAVSCNKGAEVAKGKYLVFLNNDTIPLNNWLEALLSVIRNDPRVGAVGAKLLFPNGKIQHAGVVILNNPFPIWPTHIYRNYPSNPLSENQKEYKCLTAACLLIRKDTFWEVGGFDEGYKNGYEDVDLCFKLREKGYKLIYTPKSRLIHLESQSPGRFNKLLNNIDRLNRKWAGKVEYDFKKEPKVSIIIPLYNTWNDLIECLESIYKNEIYNKFQIIIVDNCSNENNTHLIANTANKFGVRFFKLNGEVRLFGRFRKEIIYVRLPYNKGFAGGANEGIKMALKWKADYIWLLNPDTLIDKLALYYLVSFAESQSNIAIIGSKLYCYPETDKVQFDGITVSYKGKIQKDPDRIMPTHFVSGASMLIRGEFLKKHGLLREDYFLYYEDNDICLRALKHGFDVYYHPLSVVFHKGGTSTGMFMDSPQSIYYAVRNGLLFWAEYLPSAVWSYMDLIENYLRLNIQKEEKFLAVLDALEDFLFKHKVEKACNLSLDKSIKDSTLNLFFRTKEKLIKTKNSSLIQTLSAICKTLIKSKIET